jgi:hypothetical protein
MLIDYRPYFTALRKKHKSTNAFSACRTNHWWSNQIAGSIFRLVFLLVKNDHTKRRISEFEQNHMAIHHSAQMISVS